VVSAQESTPPGGFAAAAAPSAAAARPRSPRARPAQVGESIRGCDVFLVQPTAPPVNDNLMELLMMIDACRRASARSITAVLPYFGYARADRKTQASGGGRVAAAAGAAGL
jgi:hypothetical protein